MGKNLVIVAIPEEQDRIWKISSEKIPHLTLLFLGDSDSNPHIESIVQFVQHAIQICEHGPFYLDVDRRDTLGPDEADVLFFSQRSWNLKWIKQFRGQLLKNEQIRSAFDSVEQFPEWQPHLTLGYPATPAKDPKDPFDSPIYSVCFDRIAVWTGDFDGPDFRLEWPDREFDDGLAIAYSESGQNAIDQMLRFGEKDKMDLGEEFIKHIGIKGMHWGHRSTPLPVAPTATSKVPAGAKRKTKIEAKGGENHPAHEDAIKVAQARIKLHKSGPSALSNNELRDVANRIQLENQVALLTSSKGKQFVKRQLQTEGTSLARAGVREGAKRGAKKAGAALGTAAALAV